MPVAFERAMPTLLASKLLNATSVSVIVPEAERPTGLPVMKLLESSPKKPPTVRSRADCRAMPTFVLSMKSLPATNVPVRQARGSQALVVVLDEVAPLSTESGAERFAVAESSARGRSRASRP